MLRCLRLAIALTTAPVLAGAQARDSTAVLEGYVRDAVDSGAIAYAEIRIGQSALYARADGLGRYRIVGVPPGQQEVFYRMLGYTALRLEETFVGGETMTRDLYLARVPRLLTAMEVRGKQLRVPAGYETVYRRAARGLGSFVTREQIDSLNPRDVLGILRTLPFVRTENTGNGGFNRIVSQRCGEFQVLLNGTPVGADTAAVARILYSTPPGWIQAIEVYDSRARMPVEFLPNCGVVAVWTRTR